MGSGAAIPGQRQHPWTLAAMLLGPNILCLPRRGDERGENR